MCIRDRYRHPVLCLEHTSMVNLGEASDQRLFDRFCSTFMRYGNVQAYSLPLHQLAWQQIQPAEHLGQDCATYKWSQSQTEVDVYVQIPNQIRRHEVIGVPLLLVMHNSAF